MARIRLTRRGFLGVLPTIALVRPEELPDQLEELSALRPHEDATSIVGASTQSFDKLTMHVAARLHHKLGRGMVPVKRADVLATLDQYQRTWQVGTIDWLVPTGEKWARVEELNERIDVLATMLQTATHTGELELPQGVFAACRVSAAGILVRGAQDYDIERDAMRTRFDVLYR